MGPATYQTLVEDLFDRLDRDEVLSMLFNLYPGEDKSYDDLCRAWDVVTTLEPDEVDMVVEVTVKARVADVSGRTRDDESYAIEFTRWEEWLAMPVRMGEGAEEMGEVEALAHILHEMTWHGYTQAAISAVAEDIASRAREAGVGLEEEDDG